MPAATSAASSPPPSSSIAIRIIPGSASAPTIIPIRWPNFVRLHAVAQERYLHVAETMATRQNPNGMIDRREIDEKIAALEAARIAEGRPSASFATPLKT